VIRDQDRARLLFQVEMVSLFPPVGDTRTTSCTIGTRAWYTRDQLVLRHEALDRCQGFGRSEVEINELFGESQTEPEFYEPVDPTADNIYLTSGCSALGEVPPPTPDTATTPASIFPKIKAKAKSIVKASVTSVTSATRTITSFFSPVVSADTHALSPVGTIHKPTFHELDKLILYLAPCSQRVQERSWYQIMIGHKKGGPWNIDK
jgi:hypothetical protein